MKLTVFHAADGDCLLLTSSDGRRVLVDGGRAATFRQHTAPILRQLAEAGEALDLVVVSHIDADHITGITELLRGVAAWTVFDFQSSSGNERFPQPAEPRPPRIDGLWHNSWRAQVGELAGPIEARLGQLGRSLGLTSLELASPSAAFQASAESIAGLAQSIPDGIELLHLVDDQTPIPRNAPFGDLVLLSDPPRTESLGSLSLTVLGPAPHHLERLRKEWREWLERQPGGAGGGAPGEGGGRAGADGPGLGTGGSDLSRALQANVARADATVASLELAAEIIEAADASKVTVPNRASILLLAEENGRSCLLTGDAAEDEILDGLAAAGGLDSGPFRCNVVKVQHHGAEHNLSRNFAAQVLGEHYVFCANGAHHNPDPSVVRTIVQTRLAEDPSPFTLWFNCSPTRGRQRGESTAARKRRATLREAIGVAKEASRRRPERLTVRVLDDDEPFFEIEV